MRAAAAAAIDAEELFWLKIQPGSVVIDAKLKLKVAAGQIRRLQLVADPALQLLAVGRAGSALGPRADAGGATANHRVAMGPPGDRRAR